MPGRIGLTKRPRAGYNIFAMSENKKNIIWAVIIMAIVTAFVIGIAVYIVKGRERELGGRAEATPIVQTAERAADGAEPRI